MVGDLSKPLQMPVMTLDQTCVGRPQPEGMENPSVWSTWRTGGSDREPAQYPCSLDQRPVCPGETAQQCGKSLVLRENSVWPRVVGSADGTGYVTTQWLPPNVPYAQLGFCTVSRKVVDTPATQEAGHAPGSVSQLFMDDQPLLHYWDGAPFLFRTKQTPFIYMVPNAIWVKTGGSKYRVDVVSAKQRGDGCGDCIGY